jgi:hypothetical protein
MMKAGAFERDAHRLFWKVGILVVTLASQAMLAPFTSLGANTVLTLVLVKDEQNRPVRSEIVHFPPDTPEKPIPLDETDHEGRLPLSFECKLGTKIQARPKEDAYLYSSKRFCRPQLDFRVTPKEVYWTLKNNLDSALEAADFATAALAATELASIGKREGVSVAGEDAEFLSYIYAAEALKVPNGVTFDQVQQKPVVAAALKDAVQSFQRQMGIEVTGKLDYVTLSTMSGTTSAALRYGNVQYDVAPQ